MFKVLQIDHVELFVPSRYDAARWYEQILGLQTVPECEPWAVAGGPLMISSDGGSTKLALFEGQPAVGSPTAAFRRVAFRVTAGGFAEFLRRLPDLALTNSRAQPVTADSVVDHQQAYSIYFEDPWGHLLEVTTYDYDETSAMIAALALKSSRP
jgi:catechol 2,3-dioxygenase-like lactoylglutathione lyase family enzyme